MNPKAVGQKLKSIYPEYAAYSDEQVGLKFITKYGKDPATMSALGVESGGDPVKELAETEATAKLEAIKSGKAKPGQDAQAAAKADSAENIVKTLEDLYFKGGQTTGLAFGQKGLGGRLPGVGKEIERKVAPGKDTEQLNTYKRILESKRSLLARAAGDVGNLALQEQILAGRGLPDETATPEEAFALFRESRNALGLSQRERLAKIEEKYVDKQSSKSTPQQQITAQPVQKRGIQDTTIGELANLIPGLLNTTSKGMRMTTIPGIAAEAGLSAPVQGVARSMNPNSYASIDKLRAGQLPSTEEASGAAIENLMGLLGVGAGGVALKGAGAGAKMLNIAGSATKARRAAGAGAAAKNIKIGNTNLQKLAEDMIANKVPTYKEKPLIEALSKGKGIDPNDAIDLLVKSGQKTFTKGGDYKTNRVADFYELLRTGLREEFSKKAPQVIKETSNIARGMKAGKIVKKAAVPVGLIVGGELIRRGLFGQNQNQ